MHPKTINKAIRAFGGSVTIAACYVSPEGIVFGADSTASGFTPTGLHYFNHNQKLFQVGENSTIGVVTWGLASLGSKSLRTFVAEFADDLSQTPANDMDQVAKRFAASVEKVYKRFYSVQIARYAILDAMKPNIAISQTQNAGHRNPIEEKEYTALRFTLALGFCIGGHVAGNRTPRAFEIIFDVPKAGDAAIDEIPVTKNRFYGAPKIFKRLVNGYDDELLKTILSSSRWSGSEADLVQLLAKHELKHPILPIREAVDFLYVCIQATIKAIKFSTMPQVCGGPIELAVITSDRNFRWIRHKEWHSAIDEGQRS